MILTVNDSASTVASHLSKDTFVLHDVTYVIDDEYQTKPQIYLSPQQIKGIQLQDQSLVTIISKCIKNKVHAIPLLNTYFLNEESVLYQSVREGVQTYEAMVVLSTLQKPVLTITDDLLGHNGTSTLYNYIR